MGKGSVYIWPSTPYCATELRTTDSKWTRLEVFEESVQQGILRAPWSSRTLLRDTIRKATKTIPALPLQTPKLRRCCKLDITAA